MRKRLMPACALAWPTIMIAAAACLATARPAQAHAHITSTTQVTTTAAVATRPATEPHPAAPGRYVVKPGDSLSAIATARAVPGGWQALYNANKRAIGPDPNLIHPGAVLVLPGHAARPPAPATTTPRPLREAPPPATASPSPPAATAASTPGTTADHDTPWWLTVLLSAAVLAAAGIAALAVTATRRRRPATGARRRATRDTGQETGSGHLTEERPRIIFATHERLIVTYSRKDDTAYVLSPPGTDPEEVLKAARLVLPEDVFQELAGTLGVTVLSPAASRGHPSHGPGTRPRPPPRGRSARQ